MSENLALVTGASSGIGYWLARELGSRGYDLVVCSAGERLSDAVRALNPVVILNEGRCAIGVEVT